MKTLIAMEKVKQYYFKRLEELSIESKQLEKKSKIILIARLLSFILIVGSFYFLGFTLIGFFLVTVVVVVFLTLVAMSVDNKNLIKFNKSLIQINQDEINAIEGKWSFDSGTEFEVSTHGFSSDLDLFVDKGVFSFLNRTWIYLGAPSFRYSPIDNLSYHITTPLTPNGYGGNGSYDIRGSDDVFFTNSYNNSDKFPSNNWQLASYINNTCPQITTTPIFSLL